jgi:hypothetical protein
VVWSEIFPWLIIFRTFRIAISFRMLIFGAVGMMAMLFGSYAIRWCFSGETAAENRSAAAFAEEIQETDWYAYVFGYDFNVGWVAPEGERGVGVLPPQPHRFSKNVPQVHTVWTHFGLPFELSRWSSCRFRDFLCCIAVGVWIVFVWGFFGTTLSRASAVYLINGGRMSFREMVCFGLSKWRAGFAAPLLPLLGMLLLALPILLLGLLLRLSFLAWVGAIAWPIALLAGFVITILLLGLIFGWPLMLSAIAVEDSDSFDSLSRTYAYIYQKPLHYLFYVVMALFFGTLCWYGVLYFANLMLEVTQWVGNWIVLGTDIGKTSEVIRTWEAIFRLLVLGFSATYFWSAITSIYLLLRRNVDAVEMDQITMRNESPLRTLPKIVTDDQGAPAVEG